MVHNGKVCLFVFSWVSWFWECPLGWGTERTRICWFTPQMPTVAVVDLRLKPGAENSTQDSEMGGKNLAARAALPLWVCINRKLVSGPRNWNWTQVFPCGMWVSNQHLNGRTKQTQQFPSDLFVTVSLATQTVPDIVIMWKKRYSELVEWINTTFSL